MAIIFSSSLADVSVAVVTLCVLAYLYVNHAFKYWERRGVHYIPPTSIFGNLGRVALRKVGLGEYLWEVYQVTSGHRVVGLFAGLKPILMVRDLDVVRSILVKDSPLFLDKPFEISPASEPVLSRSLFFLNGKKWIHVRRKLTPTFATGKIKKMFTLINDCGKGLLPCIDQEISKGNSVRVKDTVARYTTDVIASCGFGVNANALADPKSEFREVMRKVFERNKLHSFANILTVFLPWLRNLLGLKGFDSSIDEYLRKTFWDVVQHRETNNIVRHDFVDTLMQMKHKGEVRAEDAHDAEEIKRDSKYVDMGLARSGNTDITLEDDDFVGQAYIFIAAGFETASSVISFTLLEMALNSNIQDKLRSEMWAVLKKHSEVTYDAIAEMTYLEMVMCETMRKYPTLRKTERKCSSDYKIPGTDVILEKGTEVYVPILGIHSDPDIYPEPDVFDPERFSFENKSKRHNFAFIPFSLGPRNCIGMRFGQLQVKTALVHILTTYQVSTCAETPKPPLKMRPSGGVTIPKQDIVLDFHKIK